MTSPCRRLSTLLVAIAAGACADSSPTEPLTDAFDAPIQAAVVVDPLDLNTETHTFDDLPQNCNFDVAIPNPYEGLTFTTTPLFAACVTPNGTIGLVPADQPKFGTITEILIDLPRPASSASLDVFDLFPDRDLVLNAYDGSGVLVGSASDPTDSDWVTLSVSGDIHRLGIATDQGNTFLDNLKIALVADEDDGGAVPDKDACKNDGWRDLGFKNQGRCIQFVETGKDSR